jgi:phenylacetate-CoA ligase
VGTLQKLYPYVPPALQNLGISAFGYFWYKRRFGGVFKNELLHFRERESFSAEKWHDYQIIELRKFLFRAFCNVPFYNEKFTEAGFGKDDFKRFELEDLTRLPFLEKDELRKFGTTGLLAANRKKGEFFSSSGSTGTPTKIYLSSHMHQRWSAGFEARIRNWAGVHYQMPRGMIGGRRIIPEGYGRPPFYRYNFVEKQVYFSAYHIASNTARNYLEGIQKHQVEYMTGYAAANYFLARFFDELDVEVPALKAVITSSEKLTAEMRSLFEKIYHCKAYDSYSGVEDCGLISECEFGGLHVSPDMGIIEFINDKGESARPGELAEMVCTGILNDDQPLIRYRIGDMAVLADNKCACGRNMPLVQEIVGRMEDVVIGKDGREMVRFHGIFIGLDDVREAQVIQEDYDNFTINIVSEGRLSKEGKNIIVERMKSQLGEVKVSFNELSKVPRGPNGKFKAVISNVKRKQN